MESNMINNFVCYEEVKEDCIERYTGKVPEELIDIWKQFGLGSFMDGYLKVINPDDFVEILKASYFRADISIPVLATAFGDIITWEKNEFVGMVQYRYGKNEIMISDFDLFLFLLKDEGFIKEYFQIEMYKKAVCELGELAYDECYGYVPLLALGGTESVSNLKKVKLREHIALITELVGEI